jgi:hypothetical protein
MKGARRAVRALGGVKALQADRQIFARGKIHYMRSEKHEYSKDLFESA